MATERQAKGHLARARRWQRGRDDMSAERVPRAEGDMERRNRRPEALSQPRER